MAIDTSDLKALRTRATRLREEPEDDNRTGDPKSIVYLRNRLRNVSDKDDYVAVATILQSEFSHYGMIEEQIDLYDKLICRYPEEPMPRISLASFLLFEAKQPIEAERVIQDGIAAAISARRFVRHAYNTQARILKTLGKYKELEETLTRLIEVPSMQSAPDVGFEEDFVIGLPERSVSSELIFRFRASCNT